MFGRIFAGFIGALAIIAIGLMLGAGFTDGRASDNRDPVSVLFSEQSAHDIETRMLIAYLGRQHNDPTDDYTLDVWEFTVQKIVNEYGTFYSCDERANFGADTELPSVLYLDDYLSLGGIIEEDGACNMTVIAP